MEIIKKGNINNVPGHRRYKGVCPDCDCEFGFEEREILHDQRDGDSWVHCPTCGKPLCITSRHIHQL